MNPLPSYFSNAGIPSCSKWCKYEIEILAWAYVTGMARDGDTWHEMDCKKCYELLDESERECVYPYLPDSDDCYADWWKMIGRQLKDSDGAFEVGGITWNRRKYDQANQAQVT